MHNSLKDRVLESVDIVDVVGERVALKKKGAEFVGLCPFHDDHKPSMAVSPKKQIFKCWSCGAGGDAIRFVMLRERVDFAEALELLARKAGLEFRRGDPRRESDAPSNRDALRQTLAWALRHFRQRLAASDAGRRALEYALGRGLTTATIEQFELGYADDAWDTLLQAGRRAGIDEGGLLAAGLISRNEAGRVYDRFRNRLIFPILDGQGRPVAFGGRTLGDDDAKYLNSPETPVFRKSAILYGLWQARKSIEQTRTAVIVEGYIDAVLLHQHGLTHVVATLGTALTDLHVRALKPLADRLIMCFDSDEAGVRAADRAAEVAITSGMDVQVALIPDGMDPADYVVARGGESCKSLLHSAIGALEFKWRRMQEVCADASSRGRREAVEAFLEFIGRCVRVGGVGLLEQGLLVGRLGEMLSLPASMIYELLARIRARGHRSAGGASSAPAAESAYRESVRGVPSAIVAAAEELLGVVLAQPAWFGRAAQTLSGIAELVPSWQCIHLRMAELERDVPGWTRQDVLDTCNDDATLECVYSALRASEGRIVGLEDLETLCARVASELGLHRMGELRSRWRASDAAAADRAQAFESYLGLARQQSGLLPAAARMDAAGRD